LEQTGKDGLEEFAGLPVEVVSPIAAYAFATVAELVLVARAATTTGHSKRVGVNDGGGDVIRNVPAEVGEDPAEGRLAISDQVVVVDPENIGIAVGSTPGLQLNGPMAKQVTAKADLIIGAGVSEGRPEESGFLIRGVALANGNDKGDDKVAGIAGDQEAAVLRIGGGPFEPVNVAGGVEGAGKARPHPDRPRLTGDIDPVRNQWAVAMSDYRWIGQKVPHPLAAAFIKSEVEDAMSCHHKGEPTADNGYIGVAPAQGEKRMHQAERFPWRKMG